jgi:hypothetical protein
MSSAIQQEELRPIRIGAIAQQPAADEATVTYVGLAHLLPATLQALCACAGLFFARIMSRSSSEGGSVQLEVAALERYFDADDDTYSQHVRSVHLSRQQFKLLLEWDRRLTAMPTCDVREEMEQHALAEAGPAHRLAPLLLMHILSHLCTTTLAEQQQADEAAQEQKEEVDLEPLASVFVPHATMLAIFHRLRISNRQERRVHTAMLLSALDTLEYRIEHCSNESERDELEEDYDQIQEVRRWRRQRQASGNGWQRVVALTQEKAGWQVEVGMPVAA